MKIWVKKLQADYLQVVSLAMMFMTAFLFPQPLDAVENRSILDRYSVVGVIAGFQNESDIAVIRDLIHKKSITVRVGGKIGLNKSFKVVEIARRKVVVQKQGKRYTLQYGVPEVVSQPKNSHIDNFVDVGVQDYLNGKNDVFGSAVYENWISGEYSGDRESLDINAYQLLQRRKHLRKVRPLILGKDADYRVNYKNFDDQDLEDEEKFRKKYRQRSDSADGGYSDDENAADEEDADDESGLDQVESTQYDDNRYYDSEAEAEADDYDE